MRSTPLGILCILLCTCTPAISQVPTPDTPVETPVSPRTDTIRTVEISGNTLIRVDDIRQVLKLRAGDTFRVEQYQADADAVEKLYAERGFQAVVAPSPAIDNGVVRFPIVEAVIETIRTRGNTKTKDSAILRFVRTRPGTLYRKEQVQDDVRELFNQGIFQDVSYRLEPGSELGRVELVFVVEERRTGFVYAGLTYSGHSGIVGQLEVVESNLMGTGNAIGGFVQLGGKDFRSGFQVNYHNPIIDRQRTSFDIGVYSKTVYRFSGNDLFQDTFDDEEAYDEYRSGGDFSFSRRVGKNVQAAVGFRGNAVNSEYLYAIPVDADNDGTLEGYYVGSQPGVRDGSVFALTTAVSRDRRNDPLDPTSGGVDVFSVEAGASRLDGGRFLTGYSVGAADEVALTSPTYTEVGSQSGTLTRLSLDMRRYFGRRRSAEKPNKPVPVLATRFVAGTVGGTVPFWEQFFLGGIGISGMRYARFVTADPAVEDPFVQGSQPLRGYPEGRFWGRSMVLGSMEYRIPLGKDMRGVLFVDAGDAWNPTIEVLDPHDPDPDEQNENFRLHSSVGIGLRVMTPFGPARIDFGVGSEGSRTHFSIGQIF